jgi:hypothetical protein
MSSSTLLRLGISSTNHKAMEGGFHG